MPLTDTEALKAWTTLRARAALHKVQAYRSDPQDGPRVFVTVCHGVARLHPDLASLRARVEDLEGMPT